MTQQSRNHHYLAQGYMRGFCEQRNVLFVHVKTTRRIRPTSPRGVAYSKDFYTVDTVDEKDSDEIEQTLSKVESVAIPIIHKLSAQNELSNPERADLAIYIALQYGRTPHSREQTDKVATTIVTNEVKTVIAEAINDPVKYEKLISHFKEEQPDKEPPSRDKLIEWVVKKGPMAIISTDNGTFVKLFFERANVISEGLLERKWQVLHSPNNSCFITSDNPIGLLIDRQLKKYETLAILLRGVTRYFPLDRKTCLVILEEPATKEIAHRPITASEVRKINKLLFQQAKKYVISGNNRLLESLS
jgi:hypothetical protein